MEYDCDDGGSFLRVLAHSGCKAQRVLRGGRVLSRDGRSLETKIESRSAALVQLNLFFSYSRRRVLALSGFKARRVAGIDRALSGYEHRQDKGVWADRGIPAMLRDVVTMAIDCVLDGLHKAWSLMDCSSMYVQSEMSYAALCKVFTVPLWTQGCQLQS